MPIRSQAADIQTLSTPRGRFSGAERGFLPALRETPTGSDHLIAAVIAAPRSLVPALPPRSGVRVPPSASTSAIARSTAAAAALSPKCSSIIAPDQIWPIGLAMPRPAMSGAEPCTGSTIEGYSRSGLMLPEGAMPIEPTTAGPRSDRMSPKRFEPPTTSNQWGGGTHERMAHDPGAPAGGKTPFLHPHPDLPAGIDPPADFRIFAFVVFAHDI